VIGEAHPYHSFALLPFSALNSVTRPIPYRITDPATDAPLFAPPAGWNIRRTIRGGRCARRMADVTNTSEMSCGCLGFSQHKQRTSRSGPALRDRVDLQFELVLITALARQPARSKMARPRDADGPFAFLTARTLLWQPRRYRSIHPVSCRMGCTLYLQKVSR